jgi:hypothetical protein
MVTRLDVAWTQRERDLLTLALALRCEHCGARPSAWCFRVAGMWTMHAQRVLAASALRRKN